MVVVQMCHCRSFRVALEISGGSLVDEGLSMLLFSVRRFSGR